MNTASWLYHYITHSSLSSSREKKPTMSLEGVMLTHDPLSFDEALARLLPIARVAVPDVTEAVVVKLLSVLAELTGQEISCRTVSHLIGVLPREVLKLLVAAERAGVWMRLTCFDWQDEVINDRSKGYVKSTALACHLLGVSHADQLRSHKHWGALFETFIVNLLFKDIAQYTDSKVAMHYWRTVHGSAEVDVILCKENQVYPLEIKSAVKASKSNARKIMVFAEMYHARYQIAPGIVIYAGNEVLDYQENQEVYDREGQEPFVVAVPWWMLLS